MSTTFIFSLVLAPVLHEITSIHPQVRGRRFLPSSASFPASPQECRSLWQFSAAVHAPLALGSFVYSFLRAFASAPPPASVAFSKDELRGKECKGSHETAHPAQLESRRTVSRLPLRPWLPERWSCCLWLEMFLRQCDRTIPFKESRRTGVADETMQQRRE